MLLAQMNIDTIDLVIIVGYLIGIMAIGIMVSHKRGATASEFFLAGKTLPWFMVGSALFAANISTIHLVGLAGSGYHDGLVIGNFEWMASFCLILLALIFAPFYFKSKISTLPEFLERRYSPASRTFMAFISVASALLIHIGISLYAGAKVFEYFFHIDVIYSIVIISVVTTIYTVVGGLKAIVVTETIQTFVLLFGAVAVTLAAIWALPGQGIHTFEDFKLALKPDQFNMIQSIRDENGVLRDYSWVSVLLGYPILGIWYWCSDQTIVQKVLGAKSQQDAQLGPLFAGFLKILPVFLMVLPGVLGYVLFKDIIGTDNNMTLPVMIDQLIPVGLKGILTAGMLAALMSTIAAALNSTATLVAVDIVKRIRPDTSDQRQIFIGRMSAVVVMILAMLWSTQGDKFTSIFEAINKIPMMFAPAITCVLFWGVFWRRGTRQACITTLVVGSIVGAAYFVVDLPMIHLADRMQYVDGVKQVVTQVVDGVETPVAARLVADTLGIPFMQVGWWLFCFCTVIYFVVSLLTPKHTEQELENVCFDHPFQAIIHTRVEKGMDPRVLAGILLLVMGVLYYIFR